MRRWHALLALTVAPIALHVAMRAAGWADHTSVVAGMPISQASYVIGPLYVVVHLVATFVCPVLAIATLLYRLDCAWRRRGP
jgi:hypothetical protein